MSFMRWKPPLARISSPTEWATIPQPLLVEVGQRTPANAPGNNRLDAHFPRWLRECVRLVLRRGEHNGVECGLFLGVDLDQRELAAATEVVVETSVLNWNCDLHRFFRSVAPSGE